MRVIDADNTLKSIDKAIQKYDKNGDVLEFISEVRYSVIGQPTANVQSVKHGKWIVQHRHKRYPSGKSYDVDVDVCPFCGRKDHNGDGLYCGYCGAMMDLE